MKIIEIAALSNGSHRNQTYHGVLPEGWAIIPEDMDTASFPFGEVEVEKINGVMTVTTWVPGTIPAPEPVIEPEAEVTDADMAAAILEGVNDV